VTTRETTPGEAPCVASVLASCAWARDSAFRVCSRYGGQVGAAADLIVSGILSVRFAFGLVSFTKFES
jgi:hypothetical protein